MTELSDLVLLDRWAEGDKQAGSELIDRHFNALYRFFLNKVGDAADDLVQQTLMACVEARDRFRRECSFRTFLFAIARQRLIMHVRKARKADQLDLSVSSVCDFGTSPSGALARAERERILQLAIRTIPADLQIALEMHFWEEMTGPEIAQVLEIPVDTAYSRLRRAKEKLMEAIAEQARALGADIDTGSQAWMDELREIFLHIGKVGRGPV